MRAAALTVMLLLAPAAVAQETRVPFGGLEHDASQPVEITSETLELDQAAGTAVFIGTVKVGQGTLRLAADRVEVYYEKGEGSATGTVRRMHATGNVTLTNGAEAAEAEQADYEVASGIIEMQGDVLLTQGENALSSRSLRIDLNSGTGLLEGRVQTIFVPGQSP
jgi:lipopolysaccharide export system protein LptA